MKTLYLTLLALFLSAASARAQQGDVLAGDSAHVEATGESTAGDFEGLEDELSAALGELAETLGVLANRLANDPELRVSAVKAATSLVTVATVVVEEQSEVVEEALRRAADKLEEISTDAAEEAVE